MREHVNRLYRSLATVFCFFVFGLGELLQAFFLFPLLILVRSPRRRCLLGKAIMRGNFRCFVHLMRILGVLTYEIHHVERLARPSLLVVANHPTLIDIVFLISLLERPDSIVKGALTNNPFTRHAIKSAGLIPNNVTGPDLVNRCARSLEDGNSLVIFPEGSRSEPKELLGFHRGAAHIALRARKPLTPVVIKVTEHNLSRGSCWWKAPRKIVHFKFEVHEDLQVEPYLLPRVEAPLAARQLTAQLRAYYQNQMEFWRP